MLLNIDLKNNITSKYNKKKYIFSFKIIHIYKMSCQICCEDYYVENKKNDIKSNITKEKCEYILDSGKQCSRNKKENELCSLHIKERTEIKCMNTDCNKSCCKICYRTFFLTKPEEPMCIYCNREFDLEFLLGYDENNKQRFSTSFIWGPLKCHRENVLLEQTMAKLIDYQPYATAEIKYDKLKKKRDDNNNTIKTIDKNLTEHNKKLSILNYIYNNCLHRTHNFITLIQFEKLKNDEMYEEIRTLKFKNKNIYKKINNERYFINNGRYPNDTTNNDTTIKDTNDDANKYAYRGKCPKENCNGFIEEKWKCGICDTKICSKCMSIKNEEHICNPDELETIKSLKEQRDRGEIKPCPSCRTFIFKIEGCSQFWCTHCHNFFDWKTGRLIKNPLHAHNPHYTEWKNKHDNINLDEIALVAGGICGINHVSISSLNVSNGIKDTLFKILNDTNEIRDELNIEGVDLDNKIKRLSIDYLKGTIDKNKLKTLLQRHYKSSKKYNMTLIRKNTYSDTAQQILRIIIKDLNDNKLDNNTILKNNIAAIESLRKHTEESMIMIGDIFRSKKPNISDTEERKRREIENLPNDIKNCIKQIIDMEKYNYYDLHYKYRTDRIIEIMKILYNVSSFSVIPDIIKKNMKIPSDNKINESIDIYTKKRNRNRNINYEMTYEQQIAIAIQASLQ